MQPAPLDGPFSQRLEALVAQRSRFYERIVNVRRAAQLAEPVSTEICERLQQARALKRAMCERVFEIQLQRLPRSATPPASPPGTGSGGTRG